MITNLPAIRQVTRIEKATGEKTGGFLILMMLNPFTVLNSL
jgi:hypothetical protein